MRLLFTLITSGIFASSVFCQTTADSWFFRGMSKLDLNEDHQGAIADFSKSIKLEPSSDAYYFRGRSKLYLEDYRGAIDDFSMTILYNDTNYNDAYELRGNAKFNLEDYQGAIDDYSKAVKTEPTADAWLWMGVAKIRTEQKDSGCLDLSKSGELGHPKAYDFIKRLCN